MKKTRTAVQLGTLFWALLLSLLIPFRMTAQTSDRTITGKVTSSDNRPVAGATVTVKGTSRAYTTDASGNFSVPARNNDVLVFSYVGFQQSELIVTSAATYQVRMVQGDNKMSEVVVIGYGSARRANLTSAQTSISAKDMDKTVNTTLEQAIQGRSAGVYVTQNSGQPGGGISVNIRGVSTLNGTTEPLYVIDGIQVQPEIVSFGAQSSSNVLAGLNPGDVDNIQLLQGPSATAIYGTRGTNGVVLITTKRGKNGDTKFNYGFQYGLQAPPKKLEVMNLRQYAQMVKEYHAIAGGDTPQEFLDPSILGEGTDWQDELFDYAAMQKHQLSMSGGNERTTYYLGGEYLKQDGVAIGSGFDRYSVRLNLDNKAKDWLTIGANLSFNQTDEKLTATQENTISNALQLTPQIPVRNMDGSWGGGDDFNGANKFAPVNPVAIANLVTNKWVRRQVMAGLNGAAKITKDLTFRLSFNTSFNYSNGQYYMPTYKIGWAENVTSTLNEYANNSFYWNFLQGLEYNKQLGLHNIGVMVSHEAQESKWKNIGAGKSGFLTNNILDLEAGDDLTSSSSGGSGPWAIESYLGRLNYNYDNRYLVVATVRTDGSPNFGPENRWGWFPSVSAAWRISQEKFFNVPWISEMKLRVETGVTGNMGNGSGVYSPLSGDASPNGTGFLVSRLPNNALRWEETHTNNFGFNLGLFHDRVNLEFDYYVRKTSNMLMDNLLPWYMGTNGTGSVAPNYVNAGDMENKGWGFTINTVNINNGRFKWESSLNLSGIKTKINKLNSAYAQLTRSSWWMDNWQQRSTVGDAPWMFLGYVEEGLFQSIEEIQNSAVPVNNTGDRYPIDPVSGIWVGDAKFKDINGDNKITEADLTYIGNPWPKLFGGFTNTFSFKGIDMSILITGSYGNDIYNYMAKVNSNPNNINLSRNLLIDAMDYAKPVDENGKVYLENPDAKVARISLGPNGNYLRPTTRWVEDGSYLRLKNITIGYSIPPKLLSKQKIVRGIRLSVSGQNLVTLTSYSGMDPEVGAYVGRDAGSNNQAIGVDYGRYPLTRFYTASINIDF
ncbi:SusC/RagA family TonB-linked outer membrane protein [Flavihumibacter petaseus]|uniref:Putative TonB-dependent receptor n=1 Tax=Flavihumibacter petaseus NBRC 106054 TaxID=1220578 RepID=A0A0E9N5N0_9BACT|nr:TonB-dependent receptor [Flavihumibacter petaseus]GAO44650.1 putative TonB-dependent receptor [Flavihumibacter petaseus NBRC 106054]